MLLDVYSWDLVSLGKDTLTWEQDNNAMMWHLQGIPTIHRNIFVLVASSYKVSHLFLPLACMGTAPLLSMSPWQGSGEAWW